MAMEQTQAPVAPQSASTGNGWHSLPPDTAICDRGYARHQRDADRVASHSDHAQRCGAAIVGD